MRLLSQTRHSPKQSLIEELHKISGVEVPAPLASLKNKVVRFSDVTEVSAMEDYVLGALGIE